MTTTNPLTRPCDHCGAKPGQPCRSRKGKKGPFHATRRGRTPPIGRGLLLTPETTHTICQHLELGVPLAHAAQAQGIGINTIYRWLAEADDPNPTYNDRREFREAVARARARGVARHVTLLNKAAQGGYVVKTRRIRHADGSEEVEETKAAVDWRASAFVLERTVQDFARRQALEFVSSQDGLAPPEGQPAVAVLDHAGLERLADNMRLFRERKAIEAEDVVEGEVVGDG